MNTGPFGENHKMRVAVITFLAAAGYAQPAPDGTKIFETRCAVCHGSDAKGGECGPGIVARIQARSERELAALIRSGLPSRGMPAFDLPEAEVTALIGHLRRLAPTARASAPPKRASVTLDSGSLEGIVMGEGPEDLQLQASDGRVHLLRRIADSRFREVTSQTEWATYDGQYSGNRYSSLRESSSNVRPSVCAGSLPWTTRHRSRPRRWW